MFKKIKNWIKGKEETLETLRNMQNIIDDLNKTIEGEAWNYLDKIEALEQNKAYCIVYKEGDNVEDLKRIFQYLKSQIQWTLPPILIIPRPIKELTKKEILKIKDQWGKK